MQMKAKRKTYYVNGQIQGALIRKVMHYWLLSLFVVGGLTFLGMGVYISRNWQLHRPRRTGLSSIPNLRYGNRSNLPALAYCSEGFGHL